MSSIPFTWHHRVTYAECTLGNHVYYSRYLDWLEAARGEFFRSLGFPLAHLQSEHVIFPVIECHIRYLLPARYDDEIRVQLRIDTLKRVRLVFSCDVTRIDDGLLLQATTTHACTDLNESPQRIPPPLADRLKHHLSVPPSSPNA